MRHTCNIVVGYDVIASDAVSDTTYLNHITCPSLSFPKILIQNKRYIICDNTILKMPKA